MARTMRTSYSRAMPFSRVCVVLAGVAVGCSGASRPDSAPPTTQRAPWRQLTSEHFTIWTDTSPARARELVPTMENLRQVVLGVSSFAQTKGKVFVIAFDTVAEVHQYVPTQFIAHAWSAQNVLRQPVIVLAGASLEDNRWIVTHELTHVITYGMLKNQPTWFAEGIATYFETARLDEKRARVDLGVPQQGRLQTLHDDGPLPIAQLFACDRPQCEDDQFYATAWALFTYLMTEHPHELTHYMEALAAAQPGDPAPSWTSVVPALPPDTLDDELAMWMQSGQIRVREYNVKLRCWPVAESPITEADVLAAKGALRFLMSRDAVALPELDKSLALDPTNLVANLIEIAAGQPPAPAHDLTAAHPDDWRAWWLAWRAARTVDESTEARAKMCALVATSDVAWPIEECSPPPPTEDTRDTTATGR